MCGRFAIDISKPTFEKRFGVAQMEIRLAPHYNVCPGMLLPVIFNKPPKDAVLMKWGLVPSWSKEPTTKFSTINARAETIMSSPAYRVPFQKQRCLIPAIGFYEWKKTEDGSKQPYFFQRTDGAPFAFAGIFDRWRDIEQKEFLTCAIITCPANETVSPIHPRMPVILDQKEEDMWLDPSQRPDTLKKFLVPIDAVDLNSRRISPRINNPQNDEKNIIAQYHEI